MPRCKPLPEIINGFKVIQDLGYDGRRWAIFECPICFNHFKNRVDALARHESCGCAFFVNSNVSQRLRRIHNGMMARCHRKTNQAYHSYGGRGIFVCDEWKDTKKFYKWAIENGYADNLTIDRINNDKGYSPDNCRWISQLENGRNKRNCITEEMAKQIQDEPWRANLDVLCKKYNLKRCTIKAIKYKQNWKGL